MRQHFIYLFMLLISAGVSAQVGINTASPHASAALDVTSTTKGFLPPRMTKAQMATIPSPTEGLTIYCTDCKFKGIFFYSGAAWVGPDNLPYNLAATDVYNPATGKVWMDRNLGATQVATSSNDAAVYGDLYQWGRATEGHQVRTSGTTSTNATTAVPNGGNPWDGLFITEGSSPFDWLTPQDNTLWQGVNGTNNPCPLGYRLPTEAEWEAERTSWTTDNAAGAFSSPLKLPMAGVRNIGNGSLGGVGAGGGYWSSTVSGTSARSLLFGSSDAAMLASNRAGGGSVRCLKD